MFSEELEEEESDVVSLTYIAVTEGSCRRIKHKSWNV